MTDEKYTADPRLEELQLLRQLRRGQVSTKASATYDVGRRLELKGEAMGWWSADAQFCLEMTALGIKALRAAGLIDEDENKE